MGMPENTIWSLMAGGLLSLSLLAAADVLVNRNLGSIRNLLITVSISAVCILLSGLPEALFPEVSQRVFAVLKSGLGPLASALGLRLLGVWLDSPQEDRIIDRATRWGSFAMLLLALALTMATMLAQPADFAKLLLLSTAGSEAAVVLALIAALRAALLGDRLARWAVAACMILAGTIAGLYLRALGVADQGLMPRILTAVGAVVFVLIMTVLIIVRNQRQARLARLARITTGRDPATGLSTGARLLSEVDHAFWRTGRMHGKCLVACTYLGNLYELGDSMGRTIDNQILVATAVRLRRAVGFRCVLGMYHPRCFVVVISLGRKREIDDTILARIGSLVGQPLQVVGDQERRHQFTPQVGLAMRVVLPDQALAADVIHELEHEAMGRLRTQTSSSPDGSQTAW